MTSGIVPLCRRSHSTKPSTSSFRHIQVGKREKAGSSSPLWPVADVAVHMSGIGPVGLDRDDVEPMLADQPLRNPRACPVELRRAMASLPQQHDPTVGNPVERGTEPGIVQIGQGSAAALIKSTVSAGCSSPRFQPWAPISGTKATEPRSSSSKLSSPVRRRTISL